MHVSMLMKLTLDVSHILGNNFFLPSTEKNRSFIVLLEFRANYDRKGFFSVAVEID